jgi:hypothetical protein
VDLVIGNSRHTIGVLRRFYKITEMDAARSSERDKAEQIKPSPIAALNIDAVDMTIAREPDRLVSAHLVLGWDQGRGSVTDSNWDYLPELGFAVRDRESGDYIFYEEKDALLHAVDEHRATKLGILDADKQLVRHGQPYIVTCKAVRPYIDGYAEANCTFDNGEDIKLLFATPLNMLPPPSWLVGKRPMDVEGYGDKNSRSEI